MRMTLRCVLLLCLAVPVRAVADDGCVRVREEKFPEGIDLWATLSGCTEVTITVTADHENMANALPETTDAAGRATFRIASFRRVDRTQPWLLQSWHQDWKLGRRLSRVPAPARYALPFAGRRKLIQGPGGSFSHFEGSQSEEAYDWAMPEGTKIHAARAGTVVGVRQDCSLGGPDKVFWNDYNYVIVRHDDGTFAEYDHLVENGARVRVGEKVAQGQPLGLSGNTGYSSAPHLHFAVFYTRDGKTRVTLPVEFTGDADAPRAEAETADEPRADAVPADPPPAAPPRDVRRPPTPPKRPPRGAADNPVKEEAQRQLEKKLLEVLEGADE